MFEFENLQSLKMGEILDPYFEEFHWPMSAVNIFSKVSPPPIDQTPIKKKKKMKKQN